DAGGIRAEHVAILPVEQAVYQNPEAVRIVERRVAAAVCRDDGRRIVVVRDDADVQSRFGEPDENFGALTRTLARPRLNLPELVDRLRAAPGRIVDDIAVDDGCHQEFYGLRNGTRRS